MRLQPAFTFLLTSTGIALALFIAAVAEGEVQMVSFGNAPAVVSAPR